MTTYSVHNNVGDGVQSEWAISFTLGYLSETHCVCQIEGEVDGGGAQINRSLTFINPGLATIDGADATGLIVSGVVQDGINFKLRRLTPKTALVHDYQDGAVMNESNLDDSNLQNIMLNHEVLDGFGLEDTEDAAASAAAALISQQLAEDWASKINGIVDTTDYSAKAYAIGGTGVTATSGKGAAKEWAIKAEDSLVDTAEYSAKHYAAKAAASAAGINLPSSLVGEALNMLRVVAGESGYELLTPAEVYTAIKQLATGSVSGAMSASDFTKLDGIAAGANAYTLPTATDSILGGIKLGTTLSIASGVADVADGALKLKYAVVTSTTAWTTFKAANSISDAVDVVGVLAFGGGGGGCGRVYNAQTTNSYSGASGASGAMAFGFGTPTGTITIGAAGVAGGISTWQVNSTWNPASDTVTSGGSSSFAGITAPGGPSGIRTSTTGTPGIATKTSFIQNGVDGIAGELDGAATAGGKGSGAYGGNGGDYTSAGSPGEAGKVIIFWMDK